MVGTTVGLLSLALLIPPLTGGKQEKEPPEPPVRLKKKDRPKAPEEPNKKTEPGKPEPREPVGPPATDPEKDPAELPARVARDMRASEDRLGQKDAGEGTQQVQRDILKNLDALIEQKKRQQQQQQQQSASNSSSSRDSRRQQGRQDRQTRSQSAQKQPQPRPEQLANKSNNGMGGRTKEGAEAMNKIADLYKDVWGHLPESLRQEMDQYAREKFMAKYGDLLKQYYATIAAKGHRKGE